MQARYSIDDAYYYNMQRVLQSLEALLPHFKGPLTATDAGTALNIAHGFHKYATELSRSDATAEQSANFASMSSQLGVALEKLDTTLASALHTQRPTAALANQLLAASRALEATAALVISLSLAVQCAADLCRAFPFILNSGRRLLASYSGQGTTATEPVAVEVAISQSVALRKLMVVATTAGCSEARQALPAAAHPQHALGKWLEAVATVLLAHPNPQDAWDQGSRPVCLACFSEICTVACRSSNLGTREHFDANIAAQQVVLQLLLTQALPCAAAEEGLPGAPPWPTAAAGSAGSRGTASTSSRASNSITGGGRVADPERHSAGHSMHFLLPVLTVLAHPCLDAALTRHLSQHGSRGVLQWAQWLFEGLPLERPRAAIEQAQGSAALELAQVYRHWETHLMSGALLAQVVCWACEHGRQEQQAVAKASVQLLPRMAAVLHQLGALGLAVPAAQGKRLGSEDSGDGGSGSGGATRCLSVRGYCLSIMAVASLSTLLDDKDDMEQRAAMCLAADACLRLLPIMADLQLAHDSRPSQPGQQPLMEAGKDGDYAMAGSGIMDLWAAVSLRAANGASPRAAAALRQLHATACRLVHWATSGAASQQQLQVLPRAGHPGELVHTLQQIFLQAMAVSAELKTRADLGWRGAQFSAEDERCMSATCAAHWEALQVLLPLLPAGHLAHDHYQDSAHMLVQGMMVLQQEGWLASIPAGKLCTLLGQGLEALHKAQAESALANGGRRPRPKRYDPDDPYPLYCQEEFDSECHTAYCGAIVVLDAACNEDDSLRLAAALATSGVLSGLLDIIIDAAAWRPDALQHGIPSLGFSLLHTFRRLHEAAVQQAGQSASRAAAGGGSGEASSSTDSGGGSGAASSSGGNGGIDQQHLQELSKQIEKLQLTSMMVHSMASTNDGGPFGGLEDGGTTGQQMALNLLLVYRSKLLPLVATAARLVLDAQQTPDKRAAAQLELAQAAASRSCAFLRCANLAGSGGGAAGEGAGSKRCAGCRSVWYCGTACSHADWRLGGHKYVCKVLAAARSTRQQPA